MVIKNEDIQSVVAEIPDGHTHIRTTITLRDGKVFTLQEAAVANIVRAYTSIKTHPRTERIVLIGQKIEERKDGYAEWQLLEQ